MDSSGLFYVFIVLTQTNPAEVWPRFQSLLNLVLFPKGQSQSTQCLGSIMPFTMFWLSPGIVPQCFLCLVLHILDNCHLEKEWEEEMLIEKRCNSISWAISRHRRPTVWRAALSSTRTFSFYQSAHKKFIWTITLWDTEIRRFNDLLISLSPMKDVEALLNIYDYVFLGFVYVKSFPGFDNFRQFF